MGELAIATCFFALLLVGCSSTRPGLPNNYLIAQFALSYQRPAISGNPAIGQSLNSTFSDLVENASLIFRVGYFGLCIKFSGDDWGCHRDVSLLATGINATQDPLKLVSNSNSVQGKKLSFQA